MSTAIPTEQLMRYVSATAEQRAVIDRYLTGAKSEMLKAKSRKPRSDGGAPHPASGCADSFRPCPSGESLPRAEKEGIQCVGRFSYRPDFNDVWVGEQHYDLRERTKARLCIRYLVEHGSFDATKARHLVEEIDPYVRQHGNFLPTADIRIHHYFNDRNGPLTELRKALIQSAGRQGRFYLNVG